MLSSRHGHQDNFPVVVMLVSAEDLLLVPNISLWLQIVLMPIVQVAACMHRLGQLVCPHGLREGQQVISIGEGVEVCDTKPLQYHALLSEPQLFWCHNLPLLGRCCLTTPIINLVALQQKQCCPRRARSYRSQLFFVFMPSRAMDSQSSALCPQSCLVFRVYAVQGGGQSELGSLSTSLPGQTGTLGGASSTLYVPYKLWAHLCGAS